MYKKTLAMITSILLLISAVPIGSVFAVSDRSVEVVSSTDKAAEPSETASEDDLISRSPVDMDNYQSEENSGQKLYTQADYSDTGTVVHAYDPMTEIREQQAEQEFRENAEIAEKTILFSIREERAENKAAAYLDDNSPLCKEHSLKKVELIFETRLESGEYEAFYQAVTNADDIWGLVDELDEDIRVSSAEPDYVWETTTVSQYRVQDIEFSQSTHYPGLDVERAWNTAYDETDGDLPGEGTIVAVIDTGVDYTHIDLQNSMWVNSGEIPDNGIDDDKNGYADDIHGYDFVSNDGDPMDDHGHGTHVAGIIGMSKNKTGGIGLAFGAKIMAVKAGQATGSFASTDIAKAIKYAVANGADVINMSFGGTSKSYLVESALRDASHDCILVAAAGNDGLPTTDFPYGTVEDFYPAGYNHVLGVMATDDNGNFARFSNWDYLEGQNCEYEMAAPGVAIYSTLPGNRYACWSGTSMAAPNVSAAAAILRSKFKDKNTYTSRFIMGQLVSATESKTYKKVDNLGYLFTYPLLNINDSLTKTPTPKVILGSIFMFDDPSISTVNNGDGIAQPGETIDIGFEVFNYWGAAKDVIVSVDSISPGGVLNPYIEYIIDSVNIGNVGMFTTSNNGYTYTDGMLTSVSNPIRVKIKEGTPNDLQIPLNLTISCSNEMDDKDWTIYRNSFEKACVIIVQNGVVLSGLLEHDMELTNESFWIISKALYIAEGVTVTVKPGTQIQNEAGISVRGNLIIEGTEEKPVEILSEGGIELSPYAIYLPRRLKESTGYISIKYAKIASNLLCVNNIENCIFTGNLEDLAAQNVKNTVFPPCQYKFGGQLFIDNLISCRFDQHFGKMKIEQEQYPYDYSICSNTIENNVFFTNSVGLSPYYDDLNTDELTRIYNNAFLPDFYPKVSTYSKDILWGSVHIPKNGEMLLNYWGTTNRELIKLMYGYENDPYDSSDDDFSFDILTLEDDLSAIYPFVTEAYLTDRDGNRIDTVTGTQQVSLHVKFNRDMAQDVQPSVSYGGSAPYTDYMPSGDWVGAREWRADFTISPKYDIGRMYIRIKGGVAADDRWLVTGEDCARFFFTISNTGAQSMSLQAEPQVGQNALTWIQDDYDTLAGYNLYRGKSYDPNKKITEQDFNKLNSTILSNDDAEFIDADVDPSVPYYYYFTVVDTDMHESEPSNVVECAALESEPPVLVHTPVTKCDHKDSIVFNAVITDNVSVKSAAVHYRFGANDTWKATDFQNTTGNNYRATITASSKSDIQYYLTATDGTNTGYYGTEAEYFTIVCRYMDRIVIENYPAKMQYYIGDEFDSTGLTVKAVYNDDTEKPVSADDLDFEFDSSTAGDVTVTVYYTNLSVNMKVKVKDHSVHSDVTPGDADGNGIANMQDYALLQRWLAGWDVEIDEEACDLNNDGVVNMQDYGLLQRMLAGWALALTA